MDSLKTEKNIGIETFFTSTKGIGGKLRSTPEDFIVNEISQHLPKKDKGKFTIARVTSSNWETNLLVRELSKKLHISRKRVSFAGTKDKRAKTTRLMSFYNTPIEKLSNIKIKDVNIEDIYTSDRPIKIGDLIGNRFETTIKDIDKKVEPIQIQNIIDFIITHGGFPNFYGIQRFGIIRPVTHIVGKQIVSGDFEKAVMSYIANPIEEDVESYMQRKKLQETYDFSEALNTYPNHLTFEKTMLNSLVVNPKDFIGALEQLPRNLLTMFIYAYQSYLFNRILSKRIKSGLPINKAVIGDIILPVRKNNIDETGISVTDKNIEKVNKQVSKGKAFVSGLLFGSDSEFSNGEMGEIEHKVVNIEKLHPGDFIIPEIPYLSSSGTRRPILASVNKIDFKLNDDKLNDDKLTLILNFELRKGCYATSLLREFMKSEDIRNY